MTESTPQPDTATLTIEDMLLAMSHTDRCAMLVMSILQDEHNDPALGVRNLPAIAEHGGRIVKNTGDGFLAEFPSAVEAVRAALQFQSRVKELTIGDAEERRIVFRVGVNIGDVVNLAREAEHRTKNILATVLATVRLSKSDTVLSSPIWASRRSRTSHARSGPMRLFGMDLAQ
jgi:hypothetical protein